MRPRPNSACASSIARLSRIDPSLDSYSFPPAPHTAEGLQTFNIPKVPAAGDPAVFAPLIDDTSRAQFTFVPPDSSSFVAAGENPYPQADCILRSSEAETWHEAPGPLESTQFSTLGQAIYDGQDARQVLSSFTFSKLLTPFLPHEDHLPVPPFQSQTASSYHPDIRTVLPCSPTWSQPHCQLPNELGRTLPSQAEPDALIAYSFPSFGPRDGYAEAPPSTPHKELPYEESPYTGYVGKGDQQRGSSSDLDLLSTESADASAASQSLSPTTPRTRHATSSCSPCADERSTSHRPHPRVTNPRSVVGFFRPSPQSMLAPEAVRDVVRLQHQNRMTRGSRGGVAWNAPLVPTNVDFASLPTKASRGRKPATAPRLDEGSYFSTAENCGGDGQEAGAERTEGSEGRKKNSNKVWLCQVKECGKVFKRGEHLQRHIRSIHTGEKPFQCQWPTCGRYFSRHDNLNQHLRVHRSPDQSIEEFSAQVAACFARRLAEVERETRAQAEKEALGALLGARQAIA